MHEFVSLIGWDFGKISEEVNNLTLVIKDIKVYGYIVEVFAATGSVTSGFNF